MECHLPWLHCMFLDRQGEQNVISFTRVNGHFRDVYESVLDTLLCVCLNHKMFSYFRYMFILASFMSILAEAVSGRKGGPQLRKCPH